MNLKYQKNTVIGTKWKWRLICFLGFMLFATGLAYTGNLPVALNQIPNYDLLGHFFILGILCLLVLKVTERWSLNIYGINLSVAPVAVTLFSIADEFFQKTSPNRNFSVFDMVANLAGIWIFYAIYLVISFYRMRKVTS